MAIQVQIPALGESITQAVLLKWHKADGEMVKADEPLCELETDKANVDVPSPGSGVLKRAKQEGQTVKVGEAVATIDPDAIPSAEPAARGAAEPSAAAEPGAEEMSPSVRRIAAESGVNPARLSGTGKGGRVTKQDMLKAGQVAPAPRPSRVPPAEVEGSRGASPGRGSPKPAVSPATAPAPAEGEFDADGIRREPMSNLRKRIAERLVSAQRTAAILTTFNEVDMAAILDLRAKFKDRFAEVHGVSLGLMSFFVRGAVLALREFPRINASIEGDQIVYHQHVHLGIAVSTERGLAVPVLRNADLLSFAQIEREIKRLAEATKTGKLGLDELAGGTFTITNGGVFGSLLSTPILNPPQSGILGMHTIQKRPVAVGDTVEVHPMMYIALSYDHRLVDGRESVSFLVRLKHYLEDPSRLILEI